MYKVGIELEIKPAAGETRSTILEHLIDSGIGITWEGYSHEVMNRWKAVSDVSLENSNTVSGFEIVSYPMSGIADIENEVSKVTQALKGKATVDRECAYHVHIDVIAKYWARRRVDVSTVPGRVKALKQKQVKIFCAKLLRNYAHFQPAINQIVAPSRRTDGPNPYNGGIQPKWANIDNLMIEEYGNDSRAEAPPRGLPTEYGGSTGECDLSEARYNVINFISLAKYGTVEFRQFQGTINKTKILNWMRLTERFVARTADRKYKNHNPNAYPQTIEGMCDFLGFGKHGVRKWAHKRAQNNGFRPEVSQSVPRSQTSQSTQESGPSANLELSGFSCSQCCAPVSNEAMRSQVTQYGLRAEMMCESCEEDHQIAIGETEQETVPSANNENTEITEILLVLENDYNSYHRIRNALSDYENDIITLAALRHTVRSQLIAHGFSITLRNVIQVITRFTVIRAE